MICKVKRQMMDASEEQMLEPWVDYIQQATSVAEKAASLSGMVDWTIAHRPRKWTFAGKVARAEDQRWNEKLLGWRPEHSKGRPVGRPRLRWSDDLCKLAGGDWIACANNQAIWNSLPGVFAEKL